MASCPFPVGSIYLSVTDANPSETFPGTEWQSIGSGRVLQGADDAHAAGTEIEAGLPNITGLYDFDYGELSTIAKLSGAFYVTDGTGKTLSTAWEKGKRALGFDASQSNAIYGKSNTVQPPALAVYIWQRTA